MGLFLKRWYSLYTHSKDMDRIVGKINLISSTNKVLSLFLFIAISLSIVGIVFAATPNPGHDFSAVAGGVAQGDILYGSAAETQMKVDILKILEHQIILHGHK